MSIITLTTDFGLDDSFAGIMKGVTLSVNRNAKIIDITHQIKPYDITQAAFAIASACEFFPERSVHVCVVDPGVGSGRRPIIISAGERLFVGPDNGAFTKILQHHSSAEIYKIVNADYMLPNVSRTFHGRDIFAPVAGWLSIGEPLERFGPQINNPALLDLPEQAQAAPNLIVGEVIHIDRFGNAITNVTMNLVEKVKGDTGAESVDIIHKSGKATGVLQSYASARDDELSATYGSWDTVELFIKNGGAAKVMGISVGDRVEINFY
ncbi:hypothetical protein MNBD_NITROSPINAE02-892 [hydrothermal vent metagenome]|uniref:Adenosyl-chloride synthase n=1 Tax=hydrothermal vent metagenome TaxID=652676 RepID=A0A3B1C663_9ZZZZ